MTMLRSRSKIQPRPAKQYEGAITPERPRAVMATNLAQQPPSVRPILKLPRKERTRMDIRQAARGEECTVRIVGACVGGTETTVLAHWPGIDGDRGMGIKSIDAAGAFCCAGCHDVVDGRRPLPPGASRTSVELDWHRGHLRTLVRLAQKGLI